MLLSSLSCFVSLIINCVVIIRQIYTVEIMLRGRNIEAKFFICFLKVKTSGKKTQNTCVFLSFMYVKALSVWLCLHVHYEVTTLLCLVLTKLFKRIVFSVNCEMQHVYIKQNRRCSSPYCFKSTLYETIIRFLSYYKRLENKILVSENYTKSMLLLGLFGFFKKKYIFRSHLPLYVTQMKIKQHFKLLEMTILCYLDK